MDDRPGEREERDLVPFQFEEIKTADDAAVLVDEPCEENLDADLDELIAAAVDETEHQRLAVAIRSDNGDVAEDHLCRRTRKTGEHNARDKRVGDEAVIRFDGDEQ